MQSENSGAIRKTVVSVDLVGFSRISRFLQDSTGTPTSVRDLQLEIQEAIHEALKAAGAGEVMKNTGDGALLLFDAPAAVDAFAEALHRTTEDWNRSRVEGAKRWFRVGAATGPLARQLGDDGRYDYAGTTIATAVRLEAASQPGELLLDTTTYDSLPQLQRERYEPEERIVAKHAEVFLSRRRRIVSSAPAVAKPKPSEPSSQPLSTDTARKEVLRLFKRFQAADKLIYLLNVSFEDRPSKTLNLRERKMAILDWSDSHKGCGVLRLLEALRELENDE